jgi:hypothetical protein
MAAGSKRHQKPRRMRRHQPRATRPTTPRDPDPCRFRHFARRAAFPYDPIRVASLLRRLQLFPPFCSQFDSFFPLRRFVFRHPTSDIRLFTSSDLIIMGNCLSSCLGSRRRDDYDEVRITLAKPLFRDAIDADHLSLSRKTRPSTSLTTPTTCSSMVALINHT